MEIISPNSQINESQITGDWIAGFFAGEGHFSFVCSERYGRKRSNGKYFNASASVQIHLRDDDVEILKKIQSYWKCGSITFQKKSGISNPQATLTVSNVPELCCFIIPFFEIYPLHAKKQDDFLIWKRGVEFLHEIQQRPYVSTGVKFGYSNWADSDKKRAFEFAASLKNIRKYKEKANV